ncbi:RadC family protein [Lactococcus fujiensis]|uniref:DNA repair protein n=1 Tax=Lactococcus fujiensis JCM 16395 TaxID=1291764 RepID=A0A2A5RIU4_9LACT|nr:DNA repair protein RadC [Lactococcus fujiensis]PCR99068.1 DNA repair protein [Lactococcus fujiensis JCM 16395]
MYAIKKMNQSLLPRERLLEFGANKLSNQELLAILLRTGIKEQTALDVATTALKQIGNLEKWREASLNEWKEINGIGEVKALEIMAMIELGKRIYLANQGRKGQILSSADFGNQLANEMKNLKQEHLMAVYLDAQNKIIEKRTIFKGTIDHSIANPREIIHFAIKNLAVGMIVVHNHPSGNCQPSRQDRLFTLKMQDACGIVGLKFLDHFVIGDLNYFSFREEGLLQSS